MLKIKEFAKLCQCSIYTLRYYDEVDLLKPRMVNDQSGYRYYTQDQIDRFIEIKELQDIGFTVQEIKEMDSLTHQEIADLILKKVNYLQKRLEKSIVLMKKYIESDYRK